MDPFLGQMLLVGFNFAPVNYFQAQGQILPISQFTALFALLGVTFGGNGTSNFQLPNLTGNAAIGVGQSSSGTSYSPGETGGEEYVTLNQNHLPPHTHIATGDLAAANNNSPIAHALAKPTSGNIYSSTASSTAKMSDQALTPFTGGGTPHPNMMPFLALNWIIAYNGVFPQRQ
jgi:microcystin-dependent protein